MLLSRLRGHCSIFIRERAVLYLLLSVWLQISYMASVPQLTNGEHKAQTGHEDHSMSDTQCISTFNLIFSLSVSWKSLLTATEIRVPSYWTHRSRESVPRNWSHESWLLVLIPGNTVFCLGKKKKNCKYLDIDQYLLGYLLLKMTSYV